jgi:hypothetical protein
VATEVKKSREWLRIAAELKWTNHRLHWGEIAKQVGVDESTMSRARRTEEWEIVFRDVGTAHIEALAPAAVDGLLLAWAMGKAAGAVDVLRAFGLLANEKVDLEHSGTVITIQLIPKANPTVAAAAPSDAIAKASNGNGRGHG